MYDELIGMCDVRFVGEPTWSQINVKRFWVNGPNMSVEDASGAIYNWSNIIVIRKARR